jgi:hypothetical protein
MEAVDETGKGRERNMKAKEKDAIRQRGVEKAEERDGLT